MGRLRTIIYRMSIRKVHKRLPWEVRCGCGILISTTDFERAQFCARQHWINDHNRRMSQ